MEGVLSMDTDEPVVLAVSGVIATITLNRPAKLNALNPEMLALLDGYCARLERDAAVRVVILTGEGNRAFCAGADITVWADLQPIEMWRTWIRDGHRIFSRIAGLRQPVIAAINGHAFGGGLELALAADIRLAVTQAEFALPETGIGTIPGWGGTHRLPALVGTGRAKQMIFAGDRVDAVTAERWGMINGVVDVDALRGSALALAQRIAERAPLAVQLAKQAIDTGTVQPSSMAVEAMAGAIAAASADGREGVASFRERRTATFTGE
jgi:enoyl-CoA hydratase/carnithine racemase